ncbi:MAG: SPOR domain-containing protein [bacterium]|nr:SPOR domain-containing protein [candidate division KSB1 bacterium]MDH7558740.1 SPOR domain-containing protein [bacterium]
MTPLLLAQVPETVTLLLEQNRLAEIKQRLPDLVRQFPNDPTVLFLQGATETEGARAARYYKRVAEEFPTTAFADEALFRLAEYDFALGLYHSAAQHCLQLACQYPDSPLCDDAHYVRAQCLLARDERDSAAYALEWFLKKYPDSPYARLAALEVASKAASQQPAPTPTARGQASPEQYSVQVGAFREKANAEKLARALGREGYQCEVVPKERGRDLFYLVWVGSFQSEEAARRKGEELQARHGLPFRIVRR